MGFQISVSGMTVLFSVVHVCVFVPSFCNIYIYIYIQVPVPCHDFFEIRKDLGSTSHTASTLSDDDAAAAASGARSARGDRGGTARRRCDEAARHVVREKERDRETERAGSEGEDARF